MPYQDLREFLALLESKGDLRRISAPVSPELEMTEIAYRLMRSDGPALLFENVVGHDMPVAMNLFCAERRMNWALEVDDADDLAARLESMIDMALGGPPQGLMNKLRTLGRLAHIGAYQPRTVRNAPCQEVILTGEDVDLYSLPIIKCWPEDAGPYITLPLVITKDPETGTQNYGIYRMQVFDSRTTGMHWQTHKVGARHYRASADKLEVAVALGGDPASIWTGSAPLPPEVDEMTLAGFIRDAGVELTPAVSVDLMVPANAEIVLEGYVTPGEERTEGPFGDHTGYYSLAEPYPVFHVETITRRQNPIYPTTFVGRPPTEDYWMGKVTERVFLPLIKLILPEVVDVNMPAEGIFHNLVLVSMKKEYPGHARKVMYGLWGLGPAEPHQGDRGGGRLRGRAEPVGSRLARSQQHQSRHRPGAGGRAHRRPGRGVADAPVRQQGGHRRDAQGPAGRLPPGVAARHRDERGGTGAGVPAMGRAGPG